MKIFVVSLGCDKNLTDTETMLGILVRRGHMIVQSEEEAEVIVINTCCFIHDAKEESIQTILEMAQYKNKGTMKWLIVTGCLAQRYAREIEKEIPEVDVILGTSAYDRIAEAIEELQEGRTIVQLEDLRRLPETDGRLVTTGGHFAYLKIAEGCDKHCTYCIIPKVRGQYRSVPMEQLLVQSRQLAKEGVKELILVAQEITLYGVDLDGNRQLPELLRKLCGIEGIRWIRLLYCYPEEVTEDLIKTIREEEKILPYIDLPIQHCNDRILKKMGRYTSKAQLRSIVGRLREEVPEIAIRTSLITGFPGETEEEHEELLEFVKEMRFDRLGVFPYSAEEGTVAAQMEEQIDESEKESRFEELMMVQQTIAFQRAEEMVGRTVTVMVEGKLTEEDVYVGRTKWDAPEVDGLIFFPSERELETGEMIEVTIVQAKDYDLCGEVADEFTK